MNEYVKYNCYFIFNKCVWNFVSKKCSNKQEIILFYCGILCSEENFVNFITSLSMFALNNVKLLIVAVVGVFILSLLRFNNAKMTQLVGVDFEVFGTVQGVFFRKYTKKRADELSLKGWCKNTREGTVIGRIEGEKSKIEEMKYWLRNTGSLESRIEKAEFKNEKEILEIKFPDFSVKK